MTMTRAELEQVKQLVIDLIDAVSDREAGAYLDRTEWACKLLDAALARPEDREWRMVDAAGAAASMTHQDYGYMLALLSDHVAAGLEGYSIQVRTVEHVTPAGPWERAE